MHEFVRTSDPKKKALPFSQLSRRPLGIVLVFWEMFHNTLSLPSKGFNDLVLVWQDFGATQNLFAREENHQRVLVCAFSLSRDQSVG